MKENKMAIEGTNAIWNNVDKCSPELGNNTGERHEEGSVVLGSSEYGVYYTRYCIDHRSQRSNLCRELLYEDWFPFCNSENTPRPHIALLAFIRSELLLFSLHMFTIVLGVVKDEVQSVKEDQIIYMVHTIFETGVTLLLITIRTTAAWSSYRQYKEHLSRSAIELNLHHVRGRSLKRWLLLYTAGAISLGGLCLGGALGFYFNGLAGWTVLTNQFCLITILAMSDLFMGRVVLAKQRQLEDQLNVVISESQLINAQLLSSQSAKFYEECKSRAEYFSRAVENTTFLRRPSYIHLREKHVANGCHANPDFAIATDREVTYL